MNAIVADSTSSPAATEAWWLRAHRALMPDYNRKAAAYWWCMVTIGVLALVHAMQHVIALPSQSLVQIAVGTAIASLAGFFPVRIPRSKNSFAAGEIFIFLLLLLQGPQAAVIAAAGEALIGSWRTSKRWTSRIASPTMAASAMLGAGTLMQLTLDALRGTDQLNNGVVLVVAVAFALGYFVLNTMFVTLVVHLKRNEPLRARVLLGSFGWVGLAYAGSASVAALLFLTFQQSGVGVLMAAVPIIGMLLTTLHFFFRQQEAAEAVRRSQIEAAQREAEQAAGHARALADSERRFHSAFTHASIGMALIAFDGRLLQVNRSLRSLLGIAEQDAVGRSLREFVGEDDGRSLEQQVQRLNRGEISSFEMELRCHRRNGDDVWVELNGSLFSEPESETPCLILQAQDISDRRNAEARLHHIAFHDSLTGLPNRTRFNELLAQAIGRVRQNAAQTFGVMFLDFDRFKLINDRMGHGAGDEFLVEVARRVRDNVRPSDVVARLGGDEFAVLAENLESEHGAIQLAERLQQAIGQPMRIAGADLRASASIGITFSSFGYTTPEEVLRDADLAMYKAKAAGKARHALFDAGLHAQVANRLRLEGDLRRALETRQITVAYQPLFNMVSGQITGFEALARWNHPQHGPISPTTFIPVAEECGLIVPLSDFVLETAAKQLREWQLRDPAFANLKMQINVSGNDIAHSAFAQRVASAIVDAKLHPSHLTLELTENILMDRLDGAMHALDALRRLGVSLSVDDFGTGYSSLAYLSSLPIDSLKIDASFVRHMRAGSKEAEVVRAIVTLGQSLGKAVIAEGIETSSQFDQLRDMGCETGQGFHLAKPLDPASVDVMLDMLAKRPDDESTNVTYLKRQTR